MNSTVNHEAAHAAGFIAACGMIPLEVRVDRPDPDPRVEGSCRPDWTNHTADFDCLIAVLMGPLSEGKVIAWPPSKDADIPDERAAAKLVDHLNLDEHEHKTALAFAAHFLDHCEVKAVLSLIASALERVPVLTGAQIRELLGPETLDRFGIAAPTLEGEPA